MLAAHGYRVQEAGNGLDGIALAQRERPELAIVDIGLPGIDGYEVARRLRRDAATRAMRLVALTGYGQEVDRLRALQAGFDEHFAKPLKSEDLAALLANAE